MGCKHAVGQLATSGNSTSLLTYLSNQQANFISRWGWKLSQFTLHSFFYYHLATHSNFSWCAFIRICSVSSQFQVSRKQVGRCYATYFCALHKAAYTAGGWLWADRENRGASEMFKNTFQSGFLSILYSIGSKPLQIWDKKVKIVLRWWWWKLHDHRLHDLFTCLCVLTVVRFAMDTSRE